MHYSLDTNTVIALLKGNERVWRTLERHSPLDCMISSVVMHELYFGAFKSIRVGENLDRISALRFDILEFDREDGRVSAAIRAALAHAGTPIGPLDTLIAGQALVEDSLWFREIVGSFHELQVSLTKIGKTEVAARRKSYPVGRAPPSTSAASLVSA